MTASIEPALDAVIEAATRSGARPFKDATGNWASSVEVALLDAILSIGANIEGAYGAGVLPRLRAFKAFRGPANMMRVVATLGPFGLADFVPESHQMDRLLAAAGQLLDAGIQTAADVDPASDQQRDALVKTDGVPELAWPYFLIGLGFDTPELADLKQTWLNNFIERTTGEDQLSTSSQAELLAQATEALDAEHQRKSFGRMPEFTLPQLHQAIFRAEYARSTA